MKRKKGWFFKKHLPELARRPKKNKERITQEINL
jgi:hypothetical protein